MFLWVNTLTYIYELNVIIVTSLSLILLQR